MSFVMSTLTFKDRMKKLGESKRDTLGNVVYDYVDFDERGRIPNVVSMAIDYRFQELLGVPNAEFHFSNATDSATGIAKNVVLAVGQEGKQMFAENLDSPMHKLGYAHATSEVFKGTLLLWFGVFLILIGIPLILAIIGFPIILIGITAIVNGKKIKRIRGFVREYYDYQRQIIAKIPNPQLV